MAADANRLAAALAYEDDRKRRLAETIPTLTGPTTAPRRSVRTDLENLSAGLGQGITTQLEGIKGLITDPVGTAKGAYEAARAVVRDPSVLAAALSQMGQKAMSGPLGAGEVAGEFLTPGFRGARKPPMAEIDVYHGSPHRFEEFDASKIGTGEGAQAFGHGIYLAENPEIARDYQVRLSYDPEKMKIGGKQINAVYNQLQDAAARMPPARAAAEYEKLDLIERLMMNNPVDEVEKAAANLSPATQKWFATQVKPSFETYGSFYKADLPDEMVDRMLDWDKPLSEQPEAVRNALKRRITDVRPTDGFDMGGNAKLRDNRKGQIDKTSVSPWLLETVSGNGMARFGLTQKDVDRMFGSKDVSEITGNQILSRLTEQTGSQAKASEYLRQLGIPGIRYLDAGSRDGGSGTRNFVVFPGEEKKVRILERK
jgi:hypothetical protein